MLPNPRLLIGKLYNRLVTYIYSFDAVRNADLPLINLRKLPLSITSYRNLAALKDRPFLQKGYKFRDVKPQHEIFVEYRKKHAYSGIVNVGVYGIDNLIMFSDNDDSVAITYFYFGPNSYETLSIALFAHFAKNSRTILDVGAFTGLYSLVAAKANNSAKVHAFEPIELTAERAKLNAEINGLDKITVHPFAISDTETTKEFIIYGCSEASTGNSFYQKPNQNILKTIQVPVKSLDTVFPNESTIDLIKIDTEFDEHNALIGAKKLIERSKPIIFAEVLDDRSLQQIPAFLAPYGYTGAYLSEKTIELIDTTRENGISPFHEFGYGNIVFFPDNKSNHAANAFAEGLRNHLPVAQNSN